jgi:hypothetical protein
MVDNGLEIIQKRMSLKNLIDQASAKQRDLKNLNERIEKEKKELQLLEMIVNYRPLKGAACISECNKRDD